MIEPLSPEERAAAFRRVRRAGWPRTLEELDPIRVTIVDCDARRWRARGVSGDMLDTPAVRLAPAPLGAPRMDRKRLASGERDED